MSKLVGRCLIGLYPARDWRANIDLGRAAGSAQLRRSARSIRADSLNLEVAWPLPDGTGWRSQG